MCCSSLPLSSPELDRGGEVTKGKEKCTAVFIKVTINSYALLVFFFPRTKTITIEKEEDLHASSLSFFFIIIIIIDS